MLPDGAGLADGARGTASAPHGPLPGPCHEPDHNGIVSWADGGFQCIPLPPPPTATLARPLPCPPLFALQEAQQVGSCARAQQRVQAADLGAAGSVRRRLALHAPPQEGAARERVLAGDQPEREPRTARRAGALADDASGGDADAGRRDPGPAQPAGAPLQGAHQHARPRELLLRAGEGGSVGSGDATQHAASAPGCAPCGVMHLPPCLTLSRFPVPPPCRRCPSPPQHSEQNNKLQEDMLAAVGELQTARSRVQELEEQYKQYYRQSMRCQAQQEVEVHLRLKEVRGRSVH